MGILLNPILIGVAVLIILCLLKINVMLSLIVSAMVAGIVSGMGVTETIGILIDGMGGNGQTALSYVLLGVLAAGMA